MALWTAFSRKTSARSWSHISRSMMSRTVYGKASYVEWYREAEKGRYLGSPKTTNIVLHRTSIEVLMVRAAATSIEPVAQSSGPSQIVPGTWEQIASTLAKNVMDRLWHRYGKRYFVALKGYSGCTLDDFRQILEHEVRPERAPSPKYYFVNFGLCDSRIGNKFERGALLQDSSTALDVIVNILKARGGCVVVILPPPLNTEVQYKTYYDDDPPVTVAIRRREILEESVDALRRHCKEKGFLFLDLFKVIDEFPTGRDTLYLDEIHLSPQGHILLDQAICSRIQDLKGAQ